MSVTELIVQAYQGYADAFIAKIPAISAALVLLALFIVIAALLRLGSRKTAERRRIELIVRLIQVSLIIIGVVLALGMLGINLTGVLAGLGLISVGISFALQDLLVNFLAGLQLLGQSCFEINDVIEVGGTKGTVRSIGTRSVRLLGDNGSKIFIPNRDLLLKQVEVYPAAGGSYLLSKVTVPLTRLEYFIQNLPAATTRVRGIVPGSAHITFTAVHKDHAEVLVRVSLTSDHPPRSTVYSEGLREVARLLQPADKS